MASSFPQNPDDNGLQPEESTGQPTDERGDEPEENSDDEEAEEPGAVECTQESDRGKSCTGFCPQFHMCICSSHLIPYCDSDPCLLPTCFPDPKALRSAGFMNSDFSPFGRGFK